MNRKSATKVQPHKWAKTDQRYWRERVKKPAGKNFYSVQIQHSGTRRFLSLGTGNKDEAASRAVKLFLDVQARGWKPVLAERRPEPEKVAATLGDYLREAENVADVEPRTLNEYKKSIRRVVSRIMNIDPAGRYDWRNGKNQKWRERVDAVRLDRITPPKIKAWIKKTLANAGSDPARQRMAKNTLNGLIRNSKSLFGKKILPLVSKKLKVPDPHPFEEVRFFPRQSMRYISKIDPEKAIAKAMVELATPRELTEQDIDDYVAKYIDTMNAARKKRGCSGDFRLSDARRKTLPAEARQRHAQAEASRREQWKILVLALSAGLRFDEIDKLLWSQVDLDNGFIKIDYTAYFRPKTEESVGVIPIDPETVALIRGWKTRSDSEFVIAANRPTRPASPYGAYRAETHKKHLLKWLRELEIDGEKPLANVQKPIHELRKEAGSLVNQLHGIYAASRFLRHSDTRITAAHYVDQKDRVTIGFGRFLQPENIVPFEKAE